MARSSILLGCVLSMLFAGTPVFAQLARPQLIDQTAANRHGLKRAWFAYVDVGGGRSPIVDVKFDGGVVFVQSGVATTHAIDGETGRTIWVANVGSPSHPTLPLGIGETRLAVVNGTTLYILSRTTGQIEFSKSMRGVPAIAPALTDEAVFVPTTAGQVETYSLIDDDHRNLANLRLEGRNLTMPAVSDIGVAIGSGSGDLGLANRAGTSVLFRYPTNFGFAAAPTAWGPRVYAGNSGGLLYAFDDVSGAEKWSFAAGSAIVEPPSAFVDAVYVVTEDMAMFRVSADRGREEWMAKNIRKFLAASPTKVYAIDHLQRLAVLSAKSGTLLDRVTLPAFAFPVNNNDSDQIFLATNSGLIQALHEIELPKRLDYRAPKKETPTKESSGQRKAGSPKMRETLAKEPPSDASAPRAKAPAAKAPAAKGTPKAPAAKTPAGKAPAAKAPAAKDAADPGEPAADPFAPAPMPKPAAEVDPFGAR